MARGLLIYRSRDGPSRNHPMVQPLPSRGGPPCSQGGRGMVHVRPFLLERGSEWKPAKGWGLASDAPFGADGARAICPVDAREPSPRCSTGNWRQLRLGDTARPRLRAAGAPPALRGVVARPESIEDVSVRTAPRGDDCDRYPSHRGEPGDVPRGEPACLNSVPRGMRGRAPTQGDSGRARRASMSASMPSTIASTTRRPLSRVASVGSPQIPVLE